MGKGLRIIARAALAALLLQVIACSKGAEGETRQFIEAQDKYWHSQIDPLIKSNGKVSDLQVLAGKNGWTFLDMSGHSPGKADSRKILLTNGQKVGGEVMYSE